MEVKEWRYEVKRVADALGLSPSQYTELYAWSVDMVFDKISEARKHFTEGEQ